MKHLHQRTALLVATLVVASSVALTTSVSASTGNSTASTLASSDNTTGGFATAGTFMIQSQLNPRQCLDIRAANVGDGALVAMWWCVGTAGQRWSFSNGSLVSALNGRCLDLADMNLNNGGAINMWSCIGQQWVFNGRDIRIAGKCLDIAGWNPSNGATVQIWDCLGGTNQAWILIP